MSERRLGREIAVQSLYEMAQAEVSYAPALAANLARRQAGAAAAQYAERLLRQLVTRHAAVQDTICAAILHWSWERVALVERCVLEVATLELLDFHDVPARVVIDEAVEIARKFSTEEAGAFVNGVLDRIAKSHGCFVDVPGDPGAPERRGTAQDGS